jgi:hypothetical protein
MTQYALVSPDDQIVRVASNVDPKTASVKPGFRWIAVETDGKRETDADTLSAPAYDAQTGRVVQVYVPPSLESYKSMLRGQVDAKAESLRLQYITAGQGQAMVYQRKAVEARAILSDANPDPANYPILSASVGIEGKDIAEVAALVRATEDAWAAIAAKIETVRLGGKAAIASAETLADAQAAYDAIDWTLPQ